VSSCGVCSHCQGELTLYEEHWTEFGREWVRFDGKCPNCGCTMTEYPSNFYEEYDKAKKLDELREIEELSKTMDDTDLYNTVGRDRYPFYESYVRDELASSEIQLYDCIAKAISKSLYHFRAPIVIKRFGREILTLDSDKLKEDGWYNYEVEVFWRVYRNNREDYDEYSTTYGCRSIYEVESRIRDHHSDKWKVYIVGKFEVSSKRYGDRMTPETLHRLLEAIA